ncbi:MAG TPA: apolipoprotein N-acyltransferase [Candidatus Competibacteraceae bacterium]|nr:apolipoprotein N-acyltransferase [Candidatus Competibacteraceae bacterium]
MPVRLRLALGSLLALLAGAAMPLAYAPFGLWPLALLLPAVLLWLWERAATPHQAAWWGWCFGLGWFAVGISWIYISLHRYGHAPAAFAALSTAVVILLMSLYPAVAGWLLARLTRPGALRWLVAAPALWVLLEWVRSWLFTGFPWLSPGYSQTDSPLAGYAPLVGVYGLGGLVWLSAGLVRALGPPPGAGQQRGQWLRRAWPALSGLVALWLGGWLLARVEWVEPAGAALKIALVQGNIAQDEKFAPEQLDRTLRLYAALSLNDASGSQIIVWPETAIPAFYDDVLPYIEGLRAEALSSGTDYLTGVAAGSWDSGVFYNAVVAIGQDEGFYYKRRLLAFGEYLPLRGLLTFFRDFVEIPMADFTPGAREQTPLKVGGQPVGVSICFEAAFGSEIRLALPQARFLVNVSNDAWFGESLAPHQHLQIARMRAIEARRWMARATNTGISALIDERGRLVAASGLFTTTVVKGEVRPLQGATPYVRWGDWPALGLGGVGLVLSLSLSRKREMGTQSLRDYT